MGRKGMNSHGKFIYSVGHLWSGMEIRRGWLVKIVMNHTVT